MRPMPSPSSACSSSANDDRSGRRSRPYELTFWPRRVTSTTPSAASRSASATSSANGRETSLPRVLGTMQYEQRQLQPTEICIQPWYSRARFIGRCPVKPSNSKKPWAVSESLVRNSASLWTWPGPKATSTNGNWRKTCSLTDWAQQPPTPMTRSGSRRFSAAAWRRYCTKRSSAFSRIEQVLKRISSASCWSATSASPSDSSIPFMRSESCSFIWHPNVVTWNDFMRCWRVVVRAILLAFAIAVLGATPAGATLYEISGRTDGAIPSTKHPRPATDVHLEAQLLTALPDGSLAAVTGWITSLVGIDANGIARPLKGTKHLVEDPADIVAAPGAGVL